MYNATTVEAATTYVDSKYTVADILSSMANGDPAPNYAEPPSTSIGYTTRIPTVTTPTLTLTPTTLASLEQTFIELQSVPVTTAAQDLSRQSGFVPPVIDPAMTKSEPMDYSGDYYDTSSTDSDWMPTPAKQGCHDNTPSVISFAGSTVVSSTTNGPRRGGRRRRDDKVTPEEEQKRQVRRERNKVAAAKCRQRRVDQTNTLIAETESLEEQKANLENEIQTLQQQKEHLEFLLEAHKPMCTSGQISKVKVKVEPSMDLKCAAAVTSVSMNGIMPAITTCAQDMMTSRPNSLPLPSRTANVTEATGVVISTPSTGVFATLGLDSMVDGHTGLTPITGGPSCGSEAQRNHSDSSSPSETLASPTTLMAL